ELFFKKGLFEEGLKIFDEKPLDLGRLTLEVSLEKLDFVEFLAYYLKNKNLVGDATCTQVLLRFQDNYERTVTLILALCYLEKVQEGFELAKQCSLRKNQISYLLKFSKYMFKKSNNNYLEKILDICSKLPNSEEAIKTVCDNKQFSVQENIF